MIILIIYKDNKANDDLLVKVEVTNLTHYVLVLIKLDFKLSAIYQGLSGYRFSRRGLCEKI